MKLYIPGPVPVREEVLNAMSHNMISHRGQEASQWQLEISQYMQNIWHTEKAVLCSSSSGTGLMEGSLSSCANSVAVFSVGAFGNRFEEIGKGIGLEVDLYEEEWGRGIDEKKLEEAAKSGKYDAIALTHNETSTGVINPLDQLSRIFKKYPEILWIVDSVSATGGAPTDVDDWGIDIMITSTQKSLGLPPGMAFCTFSHKARQRAEDKKRRGFYMDLLKLDNYRIKKDQYPSTPNISLMAAAREQLRYIVKEETLEKRLQRHVRLQSMVGEWVEKYGKFFAEEELRSPTVTTIALEEGKDIDLLLRKMKDKGYLLSGGYGKLKGSTFRIAHMADCQETDLAEMLHELTKTVKEI
ncbi:MAG: alanine--glyoxylate aminotransferase family protein [Tissierellia bacterium]|nr:alanine--glyoxylate aminotransferase family protein [Tissierellia bacterium]